MALKFGRTSGITSEKDPNTGKITYSEKEYYASKRAKEADAQAKKVYDDEMVKYKSARDVYYNKNINDTQKSEEGAALVNIAGGKDRMGRTVTGEVAPSLTQAQSDKMFDARVKNKEIISINDPFITDKTRALLKEVNYGSDMSNAYVDKKNYNNYKEIYGENFDPVKWRKASHKGNMDDYPAGRSYMAESGAWFRGATPVEPKYKPGPPIKDINPRDVKWDEDRMDPLKPTKIDYKTDGVIVPLKKEAKEALTWEAPSLDKRKKATHTRRTKITGSFVNDKGNYVKSKTGIENAARIKLSDKILPNRIKYNVEKRQSAAYYGNKTFGDDVITGSTADELKVLKQDTKDNVKRLKGLGETEDARNFRRDLPQIRKAIRYAEKSGVSFDEKTGLTKEGANSSIQYFKPEITKDDETGAMSGYKAYRAQADNATNGNNMLKKLNDVATAANTVTPSYNSQVKEKIKTDNPTATKREMRTLVKDKKTADTNLLKKVNANLIEKGLIKK